MNKIESLNADLEKQRAEDMELAKENFGDVELTDADKESLDRLQRERNVVIAETDVEGVSRKETPVDEYTSSIESRMTTLKNKFGEDTSLRLVNSGDIKKTTDSLKSEARDKVLTAMKGLSYDPSLSDDDYLTINKEALDAICNYFKMDMIDSNRLATKMAGIGARQLAAILPKRFVDIYAGEEITNKNASKIKERLIAAIAYIAVTGPEMDYLNDYIDHENHLVEVGQRLIKCQISLADTLKSNETLAEILKRSTVSLPDYDIWAKYIKTPAYVMNQFAQRAVTHDMLADSYAELKADYIDQDALDRIDKEINESRTKAKTYRTVTKLELFKYLLGVYMERLATDKRRSMKLLEKDALDAVVRVKRCKLNLAFPGFTGKEYNDKQILESARTAIKSAIDNYIKTLDAVREKATDLTVPTHIVDSDKAALLIIIMLGRLVKNLTKGATFDKYNAIMLDAYFQMFCEIGGDIYVMNDILTEIGKYKDIIDAI